MNVTLTPELEVRLDERVKSGLYEDASEVVREGLRCLFAQETQRPRPDFLVSTREELEARLLEGVASLERGRRIPGEVAFKELKARAAVRRRRG